MPKGYWIVRVDVADQEKYKAYTRPMPNPSGNMEDAS